MKIEHIAMYYFDLEKAKQFYTEFFNAKSTPIYHNTKTGFQSYFLEFDSGARLEIMTKPDIEKFEKPLYAAGYAHIAFTVDSEEKVNLLTEKLRKNGYCIISGPRRTGDGYYESCIADFEDNRIEITA